MKAVGKGEVTEMETNILDDATKALWDESGYKLLAFVIWQPDAKGDGGYLNIVPNRGICASQEATIEFFQDLQAATSLIIERLRQ